MENLSKLKELLSVPKRIVIVTHIKPDGDAMGSSLGLALYLRKYDHHVTVLSPSDYPEFLKWLPGNNVLPTIDEASLEHAKLVIKNAHIIFCLDFSTMNRIADLAQPVLDAVAVKVMIDHHLDPEDFAAFKLWDTTSASTTCLVYRLIEMLEMLEADHDSGVVTYNTKNVIDKDIATCLYTGLMTDTGGFRHGNTRHQEFQIASTLVELGADPHKIANEVLETNSLERLKLVGYALSEKLKVLPDLPVAYITLSKEEMERFGAQTGDTEGLVNHGLSIKGIKLAVFAYDRGSEIKLSFRSVGDFPANEVAKRFNGGGHKNAAGGSSKDSLEQTMENIFKVLPEYF